jgi:hypothetical protein
MTLPREYNRNQGRGTPARSMCETHREQNPEIALRAALVLIMTVSYWLLSTPENAGRMN